MPKIPARPGFCGARTYGAGLMPGSGETITVYSTLAAGLRVVDERCLPGSMTDLPDFLQLQSGLVGLAFLYLSIVYIIFLQAVHSRGTKIVIATSDFSPWALQRGGRGDVSPNQKVEGTACLISFQS